MSSRARVLWNARDIERSLEGELARIYHDHVVFPWLQCGLLETDGDQCLLILKGTKLRGLRGAKILYLSDRAAYARHIGKVSLSLLTRFGYLFTRVESRFLHCPVPFAREVGGYTRKLYLSRELPAEAIDYIYSESMCLDL